MRAKRNWRERNRAVARCVRALRAGRRSWVMGLFASATAIGLVWMAIWGLISTVPLPARLSVAPSTVVSFADGSPAHVFLSADDKYRMQANLDTIDPDYVRALIRFEDKRFRYHLGVDPLAIVRAFALNVQHGRVVSGGSTITMQLVRLVEPRPRRLRSKFIEAARALQIELRLSKEEILAAYLSFTSYGRNLEGIEAASFAYFGHSPRELTPEEIATLLAVPQKPSQRFASVENRERLTKARDAIAQWLIDERALGEEGKSAEMLLQEIRRLPAADRMRELPRRAPHIATWLRARYPKRERIQTTLDAGTQRLAATLVQREREAMAGRGIHNGSVVVVDHKSSTIRALVGNFDFFDDRHGGQIPGFHQARSPGSALKPFIYAMALDRGLTLPEHLVADVPVSYGGYAPNNYDGRFAGLVSMEEALSQSLNIPFVRLLSGVGIERFVGLMRSSGVSSLRASPGYYGLSAAIGAMEMTPVELASLYATLAQDGRYRPLRLLPSEAGDEPQSIFSPGASYLTRRALASRDRPDFPDRRRLSGMPPRIHWKTGTSYGHRDAWAVGSGDRFTAVVWLGNFDNAPSVDLVGAEAAGPLLFDVLEALAERHPYGLGEAMPADLTGVHVCAYSGRLPTAACPETKQVVALRSQVPSASCPFHISVDVDSQTGEALNASCRGSRSYQTETFVVWPASIRRWLSDRHRVLPAPPTLADDCRRTVSYRAPTISSPPRGLSLLMVPGIPASEQEVPLEAETDDPTTTLAWFVDGEFLGTVSPDERLWWVPSAGEHEFLVTDGNGQIARRDLRVRRGATIR